MSTKRFNTLIIGLSILMLGLALILGYILLDRGPRVRLASFDVDIATNNINQGTTLTLQFDRPINQRDYTSALSITPTAEFSATTNPQSIVITFQESLMHNQDYTFSLEPEVTDSTDRAMRSAYTQEFRTASPQFVYLQRNYGINPDTLENEHDLIIMQRLNDQPEEFFSAPSIRSFAANNEYVVVAVSDEGDDRLISIDLNSGSVREHELLITGALNHLALAPFGQTVLFTVQPDFQTVSSEYYEQFNNTLFALDLATEELRALNSEDGEQLKASEIVMSREGQAALISNERSEYLLVSPFNDYDPVPLGTHSATYGFDASGSEIIFRDNASITSFDANSVEFFPRELRDTGFLQELDFSHGKLFSSSISFTTSTIAVRDDWEADPTTVWRKSKDSLLLRTFNTSYDSQLLAIQLNPDDCQYDQIGINSECTIPQTLVYDTNTQQPLLTLEGFDLVWLP